MTTQSVPSLPFPKESLPSISIAHSHVEGTTPRKNGNGERCGTDTDAHADVIRPRGRFLRWKLVRRVVATLLVWLVRLLTKTLRVTLHGPEPSLDLPTVFAFLHGRQLGLLRYPRPEKTVVLTSLSSDGALQTLVLSALGFDIVRGSSSKGGDGGTIATIRAMRRGAAAALAVDGPRGPFGIVKPGALFIARATKGVIVPVSCAASKGWILSRSWDHFVIPAPWSKVAIVRGQAIAMIDNADVDTDGARATLEEELASLTQFAETLVTDEQRRDR